MKLTDLKCRNTKPKEKPYKLSDGLGLHMLVMTNGSRYWRLKYSYGGKDRCLALGVYPEVSLSEAREKTYEARKHLREGNDPGQLKREKKLLAIDNTQNTFENASRAWLKHNHAKWSSKHAALILYRLEKYLFPKIGCLPLKDITPRMLFELLGGIQDQGSNEVAKRLHQCANQIFGFAIATEKTNHNPAAQMRVLMKPYRHYHYRAMDHKDLPLLLRAIDRNEAGLTLQAKLALQFILLTFVRTNELIHARWREIDFVNREWIIPAEKMKMRRYHIVPLSSQAISILEVLRARNTFNSRPDQEFDWVFPQTRSPRKPMSNMTMLTALKKLGFKEKTTIHGFRAVAMTAIKERLHYQHDIVNRQLAHAPSDQLGRAYDRAEFLDQRRKMMRDWANYLDKITKDPL